MPLPPMLLLLLLLLCAAILLLLQLELLAALLFVIVRRMDLIPVFHLSSFKHYLFSMYPLAVLSHLRPGFAYILGNCGHARSQGGRQPRHGKDPLKCLVLRDGIPPV